LALPCEPDKDFWVLTKYSISTTKQFIVLHVFRQPPSFSPTPPPANPPLCASFFSSPSAALHTPPPYAVNFHTTLPCTTCTFVLPPPSIFRHFFCHQLSIYFPSPILVLLSCAWVSSSLLTISSTMFSSSFPFASTPSLAYPPLHIQSPFYLLKFYFCLLTPSQHSFNRFPSLLSIPSSYFIARILIFANFISSLLYIPSVFTQSWSGANSQLSPAPPRPTPPLHSSFPSPMFATPLPPPVTSASPLTSSIQPPPPNPNPFSAESLFQSNQADMLRRELDNRFLASQDRTLNIGPPPYLRAEMHQHQHHHTHVHQHTTSILPPPPPSASTLFPSPLFKDIPKLGSMDSPFYRQNMGLPGYPSYSSSLLHPGLTGPTPFVPPNHLPPFQPKPTPPPDPTKPKIVKSGKWNAMHVRIAWEVYHHQQKESKGSSVKPDLLRTPSHLFPPSVPFSRHDISFPPSLTTHRPPTFEQPHPGIFGSTGPHIGFTISPFARYGAGYTAGSSPFGVSPLVSARDLPLGPLHDPWRGLQRTVPVFPPGVNALPPNVTGLPPPAPWSLKPDPILEQREREERERAERERERLRREREEKERREREERQRKLEQQQQQERERERERREKERRELERRELERQQERERLLHQQRLAESTKQLGPSMLRDRSPLRNGTMDPNDIRVKEEPRIKEEDRYHPYVRQHPVLQHSLPHMLDRSRVLPPYPPPPTTHWPPSPAEHYYRTYDPLRYNPLMDAAMRAEEERVKLFSAYSHHAQFRPKDPGLLHLRANSGPGPPPPTHKLCPTPPTDLHKKEEPR
ncbi:hypothetical protein RI129_000010, partial [Pyrocoelia pectoralis]